MGVMTRRRSEAAVLVLARQHKVDGLGTREGFGVAEEVQRGQAPVEAIETQMLRQPVVIFVLSRVETLNVLDVG